MRKIVQVSATNVENTRATQCNYVIVALCDDGTVWFNRDVSAGWDQLDPIPQTTAPKEVTGE